MRAPKADYYVTVRKLNRHVARNQVEKDALNGLFYLFEQGHKHHMTVMIRPVSSVHEFQLKLIDMYSIPHETVIPTGKDSQMYYKVTFKD